MAKAIYNGAVVASSDATVVVEGNHYFPVESVDASLLKASDTHTWCGWKGQASYYHVVVGDEIAPDAAWYYADPKEAALEIKGRIAFWKGVTVGP